MEDFYLIIDKLTEGFKTYKESLVKKEYADKFFALLPFIIFLVFLYIIVKR